MTAAKRVLRYLQGVPDIGLTYRANRIDSNNSSDSDGEKERNKNLLTLSAYCDADWGGDLDDRKSTTGYCTFINNNVISWNSTKQSTVALSTAEAEYMALSDVIKEMMWMHQLLCEMKCSVSLPMIVYTDNQAAMTMTQHDHDHKRTKHIDIRYNFIRDHTKSKMIEVRWIRTSEQQADIYTKSLSRHPFLHLRDKIMSKVSNRK
jgi:hypothetical protein